MTTAGQEPEAPRIFVSLHEQRLRAAFDVLKRSEVKTVLDLGCGEGKLLRMLNADPQFRCIAGMDVAYRDLLRAKDRLHYNTDWVALDCELMPWSAKAIDLIRHQYAAVGTSGLEALTTVQSALAQAAANRQPVESLQADTAQRLTNVRHYHTAYANYCREVDGLEELVLAPFHVLATGGKVHTDQPHTWHMDTIATFCAADPGFLLATTYHVVDLNDPESVAAVTDWWVGLTEAGGEGMVVKPMTFIAIIGNDKVIQLAIKCRGREYLRIIYSPDYDTPDRLTELRQRGLTTKRTLALRELTLGLEAMERFMAKEPLRRVHECVFGVLALESEPVDPLINFAHTDQNVRSCSGLFNPEPVDNALVTRMTAELNRNTKEVQVYAQVQACCKRAVNRFRLQRTCRSAPTNLV